MHAPAGARALESSAQAGRLSQPSLESRWPGSARQIADKIGGHYHSLLGLEREKGLEPSTPCLGSILG